MRESLFKAIQAKDIADGDEPCSPDEALPDGTRKRILIACMMSLLALSSLFLSIETIIPLYID
jgi:hypothetical protein